VTIEINTSKCTYRYSNDAHIDQINASKLGWHYHTDYELLYVLRGTGVFQIQQNYYRIRPNNLLIIKPGEYHSLYFDAEIHYERVVIHFRDLDLPQEMNRYIASLGNMYAISDMQLSEDLLRINHYYKTIPRELLNYTVDNHIQVLLSYLCTLVNQEQETRHVISESTEQILDYIDNNLVDIHSVDDICRHVHLSRTSVQKLIHSRLNVPVMSYIRIQKCILARSLLQNGIQATEVYLQCGFNDYSTFYRTYKNVFHESPSALQIDAKSSSLQHILKS